MQNRLETLLNNIFKYILWSTSDWLHYRLVGDSAKFFFPRHQIRMIIACYTFKSWMQFVNKNGNSTQNSWSTTLSYVVTNDWLPAKHFKPWWLSNWADSRHLVTAPNPSWQKKKGVFHALDTRALVCTSCETWGMVVRASLVRGFGVLPGHLPPKERFQQSHHLNIFIPTHRVVTLKSWL